jgi:hydrophobic/amphiphilic exporter-1 (mainly G- bacteria), HAE1 family
VWLTRFAIKNPVITAMFFIGLAVYGAMSYFALGRNLFPNIQFPYVFVAANYPGASPSEMEKLVIKPIEDQLNGMENLDRLTATAQEGSARVVARFKMGTDVNYETIDVQRRVDTARIYMPTDLDPPFVDKFSTASDPILEVALSSRKLSSTQLSDLVNQQIVPALKGVPGILSVDTAGDTIREIHVMPDPNRMLMTGTTLPDIYAALGANNSNLPGGRMDTPTQETTVSIHADIIQPQDILGIPLPIPNGALKDLTIGHVATVDDGHVEQRLPSTYNGSASVLLQIQRQVNADEVKTTQAARAELAKLGKQYSDVKFSEIDASADYTNASINGVLQSLMEGIFLTAIVMLLFLHAWRNALVVMISIPTSLLATFIVMRLMGFTVDLISMMGLGLTIGILVDDSIVVLENITRHRDMGEAPLDAAYLGRTEIGKAAITITLVDVVVFLPIAFLSGIIGTYMREFGLVIVVATLFSLLVSFTLTPLLAGRWSVKRRSPAVPVWARWFQSAFESTARFYHGAILPWALRNRILVPVLCGILVVGAIALVPLGFIGSEFVPQSSTGVLSGSLSYPVGTPLATTQAGLQKLGVELLKIPNVVAVLSTAGAKPSGFSTLQGGNYAQFSVVLDKQHRRETDAILKAARKLGWTVPGAEYQIATEGGGGSGAEIYYTMRGPDAALNTAAEKLAGLIRAQPGTVNVTTSAETQGPRLNIQIDPRRSKVLGVSPGTAALAARLAIGGGVATKVRLDSGLTDVREQFAYADRNALQTIEQVQVRANDGITLVPLSSVADFTVTSAPTKIERQDRERVVRVFGAIDHNTNVTLGKVLNPVQKALADPGFLPPGVIAGSDDGDSQLYNETFSSMGLALLTSFTLVYMLMVILYGSFLEPFIVMFSVPVAIVGALGGLAIRHQTLNLFSLIAIVMLFGLVAKNGILLVDYANQQRKKGLDVHAAIVSAAETRFRPILMTTCAMIFGMLPLSLGLTEGAEERASMGTVLIGGLTSSLILTLLLVPVMYSFIMGWVDKREHKRDARRQREAELEIPEFENVPRIEVGAN